MFNVQAALQTIPLRSKKEQIVIRSPSTFDPKWSSGGKLLKLENDQAKIKKLESASYILATLSFHVLGKLASF